MSPGRCRAWVADRDPFMEAALYESLHADDEWIRLHLAHALVGADRLTNGEDAHRRMPLLDDVAEHVQVRVVGHSRLADAPDRCPHRRLSAVDRLAAPEVELVAGAATGGTSLSAELDPLRIVCALPCVDDQAHPAPLVHEARVHARVALALPGETLMPADHQRRGGVELDA